MESRLAKIVNEIRTLDHERLYVLDYEYNELLVVDGNECEVEVPDRHEQTVKGFICLHNHHLFDMPFTHKDIDAACKEETYMEMVVTKTAVYSLYPKDGFFGVDVFVKLAGNHEFFTKMKILGVEHEKAVYDCAYDVADRIECLMCTRLEKLWTEFAKEADLTFTKEDLTCQL